LSIHCANPVNAGRAKRAPALGIRVVAMQQLRTGICAVTIEFISQVGGKEQAETKQVLLIRSVAVWRVTVSLLGFTIK
jgi:hypothetical protein